METVSMQGFAFFFFSPAFKNKSIDLEFDKM